MFRRASSTSSLYRATISFSDFLSALRITGTSTPSSASTANPTSIADGCTILLPTSRPAGALFSESATASARNAYSAGPGMGSEFEVHLPAAAMMSLSAFVVERTARPS